MKYNLSEIMKRAWSIRKLSIKYNTGLSFSDCLRRSWKEFKETAAEAAKPVFEDSVDMDGFRFVLWEKHGLRRIYINNYTGHNKSNRGGYIDLDHGNSVVAAGCVKSAALRFLDAYLIA